MKEKIILVGGGGHCRSVIDVIEQEDRFEIFGIVDRKECIGQSVLGYKIIASDDALQHLRDDCPNAIVTVGQVESNTIRKNLFKKLGQIGYNLPVITSPLAYVSKHASIAKGSIVMHCALINANARVGENCIINSNALIEHDAVIENHCHISTASVVNGGVIVSQNTFFGSNATSRHRARVNGFIKAGSVVK